MKLREYLTDITECTCSSLSWRYRWVCVLDNAVEHHDVFDSVDPDDGYVYTTKQVPRGLRWLCRLHDNVTERGMKKLYPDAYEEDE